MALEKKLNPEADGLVERYCKRCGKIFFPTSEHIYKDHKGRYCSWTCFNHRNDGKKLVGKPVECLYSDGTVAMSFTSISAAREWLGGESHLIKKAITNGTKYKDYLWRYKT